MSTGMAVHITMDEETVRLLNGRGYHLYAFKAVESNSEGGMPVVWFSTDTYSEITHVTWQETYKAFASQSKVEAGALIEASCEREIDLNQRMEVEDKIQCVGPFNDVKLNKCIAIHSNKTEDLPSCGISSKSPDGKVSPLCAFPLFGGDIIMLKPIQKIFLSFATEVKRTKTVITQSVGKGILIDMTDNQDCTVQYKINIGWSWEEPTVKATQLEAGSDLVPRLIIPTRN